jgi:hypothetical protein
MNSHACVRLGGKVVSPSLCKLIIIVIMSDARSSDCLLLVVACGPPHDYILCILDIGCKIVKREKRATLTAWHGMTVFETITSFHHSRIITMNKMHLEEAIASS